MNQIKEKYRELAEKNPLLWSTLSYTGFTAVIVACAMIVLFILLWAVGVYDTLETALDLKHNSVVFLVPLFSAAVLSAMSVMAGFLMFFHKYKRPRVKKSDFRDAIAPALGMENGKKG